MTDTPGSAFLVFVKQMTKCWMSEVLVFFLLKRHVFPCSFENLLVVDYEYLCQQEAAKAGEDDDDLEVSITSILFFLGHLLLRCT